MPFDPSAPFEVIDKPSGFDPSQPFEVVQKKNVFGETKSDLQSEMEKVRRERLGGAALQALATGAEAGANIVSRLPSAPFEAAHALGVRPIMSPEQVKETIDLTRGLTPRTGQISDAPILGGETGKEFGKGVEEAGYETLSTLTDPVMMAAAAEGAVAPIPVARAFQAQMLSQFPESVQQVEEASKRGDVAGVGKSLANVAGTIGLPALIERGIPPEARAPEIPGVLGKYLNTPEGSVPPAKPTGVPAEVPGTPAQPERSITVLDEIRSKNARTKEDIRKLFPDLTREQAADLRRQAWSEKAPAIGDEAARAERARIAGLLGEGVGTPPTERTPNAIQPESQSVLPNVRTRPEPSVQQVPTQESGGQTGARGGQEIVTKEVVPSPEETTAEYSARVAKEKAADIQRRVKAGIPDEDIRVSVGKDAEMPEYQLLQIDHLDPKEGNTFSSNPEQLRAAGMDIPTRAELMSLPKGRYTLAEAKRLLAEKAKPGEVQPKPPVNPEKVTPTSANVTLGAWPESEWSAASLAKQSPSERSQKAKYLGAKDKTGALQIGPKTLSALAEKRITEIKAEAARKAAPPAPPAEPEAPAPVAVPKPTPPKVTPGGALIDVPQQKKPLSILRAQIVRRLEQLEDIDPVTGEPTPKGDLTDEEYGHIKTLRKKLAQVENQLRSGTKAPIPEPKAPVSETPEINAPKERFNFETGDIVKAYSADTWPKIRKPFEHDGKLYTVTSTQGGAYPNASAHELTKVDDSTPTTIVNWKIPDRSKAYDNQIVAYKGKKYKVGQSVNFKHADEITKETPTTPSTPVAESPTKPVAGELSVEEAKAELDRINQKQDQLRSEHYQLTKDGAPVADQKEHDAQVTKLVGEMSSNAARMANLQTIVFDTLWGAETAPYRGKPPEQGSPPNITSKVLKAQKENLLGQVADAIKVAPEDSAEKIKIDVPGDGSFTISNTKDSLKRFRDHVAKNFPDTIGKAPQPGLKSGKPTALPKVTEPKDEDLGKIVSPFISKDKDRYVLLGSYADGTQVVATDGRQLIRVLTDKAPGKPDAPVRLDENGKPVDIEGNYPNFNIVRDAKAELIRGGVKTDELWKVAKQAEVFAKTSPDNKAKDAKGLNLFINKDGSVGAKMDVLGDTFEHNVQPNASWLGVYNYDYILNATEAARRLGNEKVDLYAHSGDTGPLGFVGKNHESIVMPMKTEGATNVRDAVGKFGPSQAEHPRPKESYGPMRDPEGARSYGLSAGSGNLVLEGGKFTLQKKTGKEDWRDTGSAPIGKLSADTVRKMAGQTMSPDGIKEVQRAAEHLMQERQKDVAEAAKRREDSARLYLNPFGPLLRATAADLAKLSEALGITPAAKKAARKIEQYRQAFPVIMQSRPVRHIMDQTRDAADTMANNLGRQLGNRIRTGATDLEQMAASAMIAGKFDPAEFPALIAKAMRGNHAEAEKALNYALANWTRVEPIARRGEQVFAAQLAAENAHGINTVSHEGYLPGLYDEDLWMGKGRPFIIGGKRGGVGTGFKKGKTYDSPFDAIADGYVPKSLKLGDLVENRVKRGQRLINNVEWSDSLRGILDPSDGKPVVTSVEKHARPGGLPGYETVPMGYARRSIIPGMDVAVHEEYVNLFDALTGNSHVQEFEVGGVPVGNIALETEGALKHGLLVFDTFHASRILQKELFLTKRIGYKKGFTLLEYTDADLGRAVAAGDVTPEMAAWARVNRPTANLLQKAGLNVGRVQEAMYNAAIRNIPGIGTFNRWVFEKVTRGAMLESGLIEFERVKKANPMWTDDQVAVKVARDLNKYFGNLGRQGVFKSKTFQDLSRLAFLAPQWVESMARSELGGIKQLTMDPLTSRTLHVGTLGVGMAQGLAAYFVGTQILNMVTRGHPTWENPEKGHKLDAWIPDITGKSRGYFLSPFGVVAELTHDLIKYSSQEPDVLSAAARIAKNRSSPLFRAGKILVGGEDWDKTKIQGSWNRVKKAAFALVPTPIPLQSIVRGGPPGQAQRQITSSLGVKTDPASTPRAETVQSGREWALNSNNPRVKANAERKAKMDFGESAYKPLRSALLRGDRETIISEVKELVNREPTQEKRVKRFKEILTDVNPFSSNGIKPFATPSRSKEDEIAFAKSLDANGKTAYKQAVKDAVRDYRKLTEAMYGKPKNPEVPAGYEQFLR